MSALSPAPRPRRQGWAGDQRTNLAPTSPFAFEAIALEAGVSLELRALGPQMVVGLTGDLQVEAGDQRLSLRPGETVVVPACCQLCHVRAKVPSRLGYTTVLTSS